MTLLRRLGHRWFRQHALQLALAILGIALGVAMATAIDLTSRSAERAFELSSEAVAGRRTHEVVGGRRGVDEALYTRLRVELGLREVAPVVEGAATLRATGTRSVQLLGIDVFAEAPLRPWLAFESGSTIDLAALLTRPGVLLVASLAAELGVTHGSELDIEVSGLATRGVVAGVLDPADEWTRQGLANVAICDLATAQELLGREGRLDRIDLRIAEGDEGRLDALRASLPPDVELRAAGSRAGGLRELTRGFRVNLQALGLLALLVGGFLIYNTMLFSVVRRRKLLGILRALGATRGQILRMLLGEALVLAGVGVGLGLLLGIALAFGLLDLVTQTINDHYFRIEVRELALGSDVLLKAALLGFAVCLVATLQPALEAMRTPPRLVLLRTSLEQHVRRWVPRVTLAGGALGLGGVALFAIAGRNLVLSFAGLFAVLMGAALLTPAVARLLLRSWQGPLRRLFGAPGSLAAGGAVAGLSRTAVATAALMLAVATVVGLGGLIHSFRGSLVQWLGSTLVADVYVSVPSSPSSQTEVHLTPEVRARLRATPGVAGAATYRWVDVASDRGTVRLAALGGLAHIRDAFDFLRGRQEQIDGVFAGNPAVFVSEPFAWHHRLAPGDLLSLRSDRGWRRFPIAGVFRDYGSEQGWVLLPREVYDASWDDSAVTSMAIVATPGTPRSELVSRLRTAVAGGQAVLVRSNENLRDLSLAIFDRTFAITGVLRLLCVLVAFLGIWSALMALQLERVREVGLLRAIGATPRQVAVLVLGQTGLLGLCAGLLALPVGAGLAWIMIHVINRQSFGWTLLDPGLPVTLPFEALGLALAAALLAGVYPAWTLARVPPASALREE